MDYTRLGKRIHEERKRLHLTQAALAEDAEISDTYMGAIERGKRSLVLPFLDSSACAALNSGTYECRLHRSR